MQSRVLVFAALLLGISATQPAHAQSASHQAVAKELIATLKIGELMQTSTATMIDAQIKQIPPLAPYRDVMIEWARRYITAEAALPEFVKAYMAAFTEQELQELVKFYKTPVGQKLVAKQADLLNQGAAIGERLAQEHQAKLDEMLQARAKELQRDSMPGR